MLCVSVGCVCVCVCWVRGGYLIDCAISFLYVYMCVCLDFLARKQIGAKNTMFEGHSDWSSRMWKHRCKHIIWPAHEEGARCRARPYGGINTCSQIWSLRWLFKPKRFKKGDLSSLLFMSLTAAAICGEAVVRCLCSVMWTANWSLYLPDKRYNEERGNKFSVFAWKC